jgi:hypothetical protein
MLEATFDWGGVGAILGGCATFLAIVVAPLALLFHRRVIKPLSWVLGLKADESPTGEEVLPVPRQLAELRKGQQAAKLDHDTLTLTVAGMKLQQETTAANIKEIRAEVFPNHGSSLRDAVDKNGRTVETVRVEVVDLHEALDTHLVEARKDHAKLQAHLNEDHIELSSDHAALEAHLTRQDEDK